MLYDDLRDKATSQEHEGLVANHQKLGRGKEPPPPQVSEGAWLC